jgi:NodT family efflux transporter outer membrane factor (OMF) lipoprotein
MNMMNRLPKDWSTTLISRSAAALVVFVGLLWALPGCGIPKLQRADRGAPLPPDFNGAASNVSSAQIGWREFFNDPTLVSLVDQAFVGNQELKILTQRVRMAEYEVNRRRGLIWPFLTGRTGVSLEKPSLFTPLGAVEDQLQPVPGTGFPEPLPNFLVAADITWEIDIWRKLRNARDAAGLRYIATQEGQNYVVTRLVAEIAEDYYELMALDNRMEALNRTIEIQDRSLEVSKAVKEAGRGTELPVQRFQAEVSKNTSERMIILQDIVEVENRINFLLGRYPQRVERDSSRFLELTLPALNMGIPSQLLQYRADIRQAERELAAAGLDVQVARARFFPALNLTATVGTEAFNTKYLFRSPESLIYGVAGDLTAPLLNRSAIKADYLTANADQLEKVYDYQRTVLNAFTEVINRLAKVQNYGLSIHVKRQQLQSLEASVDNATKLFQAAHPGIEYMDVLLAQRDLMDAKMVLIQTKQEQLAAIVNAYQALGGGGNQSLLGHVPDPEVVGVPPYDTLYPHGVTNPPEGSAGVPYCPPQPAPGAEPPTSPNPPPPAAEMLPQNLEEAVPVTTE